MATHFREQLNIVCLILGDDHQALIWDIQQMPRAIEDPILAYTAAEGEINQISTMRMMFQKSSFAKF